MRPSPIMQVLPLMLELAAQYMPRGQLTNAQLHPGGGKSEIHDRMDRIEEKLDQLIAAGR